MNLNEPRSLAKTYGIRSNTLSKVQLIKSIQISQGNFDCFATAYEGECDQKGCCWREDCFDAARQSDKGY
jgi:hypothetical protein